MFMDKAGLISILYGGSVSPENAEALFERPWINGALIGGASLSGAKFVSIYKSSLKVLKNI
jgi:triosephosphate isomerase